MTCRTVSYEQHQKACRGLPVFLLGGLDDTGRDAFIRSFPAESGLFDPEALIAELNRLTPMRQQIEQQLFHLQHRPKAPLSCEPEHGGAVCVHWSLLLREIEVDRHRLPQHHLAVQQRGDTRIRIELEIRRASQVFGTDAGLDQLVGFSHLLQHPQASRRPRPGIAIELEHGVLQSAFHDVRTRCGC